ncbi:MAG: hypothetical protein WBM14_15555 [Terracidiphilus sp.]
MTLEDLEQTLPNGLHDAQIKARMHDYEHAIVKLDVRIVVGLPEQDIAYRLRYRSGEIQFHKVLFCSVEAPENERILGHPGSIWFVFDRTEPGVLPEKIAQSLPPETLCYSLYILEWESQIHIAAGDVSFSWSDPGEAPAGV